MTGDTMTVDGAAMKATLKTADGVFPVAVEARQGSYININMEFCG